MKLKLNGSELANFICDNVKNSFGDAVTLPSEYLGKNESGLCVNIRELKNRQNSRKLESAWKQV